MTVIYHLLVFIGNFFLAGPLAFEPSAYLLNGEPLSNTGNGIIRFLILIWGLWYISSILGVLYAYIKKSEMAMKTSTIAPAFYNVVTGVGSFTFLTNIEAFNTDVVPLSALGILHFVTAVIFILLFYLATRVFGCDKSG